MLKQGMGCNRPYFVPYFTLFEDFCKIFQIESEII